MNNKPQYDNEKQNQKNGQSFSNNDKQHGKDPQHLSDKDKNQDKQHEKQYSDPNQNIHRKDH